jgi:hypothetical protein
MMVGILEFIITMVGIIDIIISKMGIIMFTRPKPAYGRQGLAGSWGQDTDEVSTFLVFSLQACGAQLQNNPTWDH